MSSRVRAKLPLALAKVLKQLLRVVPMRKAYKEQPGYALPLRFGAQPGQGLMHVLPRDLVWRLTTRPSKWACMVEHDEQRVVIACSIHEMGRQRATFDSFDREPNIKAGSACIRSHGAPEDSLRIAKNSRNGGVVHRLSNMSECSWYWKQKVRVTHIRQPGHFVPSPTPTCVG